MACCIWFVGLIFDVNLSMRNWLVILFVSGFFVTLVFSSCQKNDPEIGGCTSSWATNYNPDATYNDGSCIYDSSIYYPPPPPTAADFDAEISTSWSDNWNDWDIYINGVHGTISTTWTNDWDDWDFEIGGISGDISTTWSNDWNDWDVTGTGFSLDISTTWSNNWNDWDIDNNSGLWDADVSSTWSNNWNDWDVSGDSVDIDMGSTWSNDWDDWDSDGTFGSTIPTENKVAVLFIPILISVLKAEGVIP